MEEEKNNQEISANTEDSTGEKENLNIVRELEHVGGQSVEQNTISNETAIVEEGETKSPVENAENGELEQGFDSILDVTEAVDDKYAEKSSSELDNIEDSNSMTKNTDDKVSLSGDKVKNIVIVVLVVLVIIFAWLWQGSYQGNRVVPIGDRNTDTVVVSDKKEEGTVRIVEGNSANFGIDNNTLINANQVGITAYFGNTQQNTSMTDCSIVFPLNRVIEKKYDSELVNAIKGLLQPLNSDEGLKGYFSTVPKGTTLRYIKINNGVAEVNFNASLNQVGGSCAVTAIRAQIEKTLLQFPQVKSVLICVDGNCSQDSILQP